MAIILATRMVKGRIDIHILKKVRTSNLWM
jgi:hypothetical protein